MAKKKRSPAAKKAARKARQASSSANEPSNARPGRDGSAGDVSAEDESAEETGPAEETGAAEDRLAEDSVVEQRAARLRRALLWPMALLLGAAVVSNVLLLQLYARVQSVGAANVHSFCQISKGFDCVTVADSSYAAFLGIPIALYGIEYFGLILLLALASGLGWWRVRRWDSLLFVALLVALPVSVTMALIATLVIKSVCIMCSLIYGANVLALLILLGAYRGQLGDLLRAGPRELNAATSSAGPTRLFVVLTLLLGLSQFFWVPKLLPTKPPPKPKKSAAQLLAGIPQKGFVLGAANAPIVIDEFTDYQCPHCSKAHETLLELVKQLPGKVQVRHFDFPLDDACNRKITGRFHLRACSAAFHARCAEKQGKYWPFAVTIFHHQNQLTDDDLLRYARELGLDATKLASCASRPATRQEVLSNIEDGIRRKVRGTPTFFIGRAAEQKREQILGPRPLDFWKRKVAELSQ